MLHSRDTFYYSYSSSSEKEKEDYGPTLKVSSVYDRESGKLEAHAEIYLYAEGSDDEVMVRYRIRVDHEFLMTSRRTAETAVARDAIKGARKILQRQLQALDEFDEDLSQGNRFGKKEIWEDDGEGE